MPGDGPHACSVCAESQGREPGDSRRPSLPQEVGGPVSLLRPAPVVFTERGSTENRSEDGLRYPTCRARRAGLPPAPAPLQRGLGDCRALRRDRRPPTTTCAWSAVRSQGHPCYTQLPSPSLPRTGCLSIKTKTQESAKCTKQERACNESQPHRHLDSTQGAAVTPALGGAGRPLPRKDADLTSGVWGWPGLLPCWLSW